MDRSLTLLALLVMPHVALAQMPSQLPMNEVYRGPLHMPDFNGRDKPFANFRTRIRKAISTGPDFAGHYAFVQFGCGGGCGAAYLADVATGQVFDTPFQERSNLQLTFSVKSNSVLARWSTQGRCMGQAMTWDGAKFSPVSVATDIGPLDVCEAQ